MSNSEGVSMNDIKLYTIGFAKKKARDFFNILQRAEVKKVVDIRLNNVSQLAAFTKKDDLEYFLQVIAGIEYVHKPKLAPTKDILDDYKKKKISWTEYEDRFAQLMTERRIENVVTPDEIDKACFLCSEPEADKCHRRLVAEYLKSQWGNVTIEHL